MSNEIKTRSLTPTEQLRDIVRPNEQSVQVA